MQHCTAILKLQSDDIMGVSKGAWGKNKSAMKFENDILYVRVHVCCSINIIRWRLRRWN